MFKLDLEKAEEPEIKSPTSAGSSKEQQFQKNIYFCLIDYAKVFDEGFPSGSDGKASVCNAGNLGSIPGLERSPGEGNDSPLQYSCLENPMDHGAW